MVPTRYRDTHRCIPSCVNDEQSLKQVRYPRPCRGMHHLHTRPQPMVRALKHSAIHHSQSTMPCQLFLHLHSLQQDIQEGNAHPDQRLHTDPSTTARNHLGTTRPIHRMTIGLQSYAMPHREACRSPRTSCYESGVVSPSVAGRTR